MKYNINGKDEKTLTILMAALGHHTQGFPDTDIFNQLSSIFNHLFGSRPLMGSK